MALVSIFESDKENGKTYYFRTASNVAPTMRTSLTSYPTTEGTPITDHAYRNPTQVSMSISASLYGSANNIFYYNSNTIFSSIITIIFFYRTFCGQIAVIHKIKKLLRCFQLLQYCHNIWLCRCEFYTTF